MCGCDDGDDSYYQPSAVSGRFSAAADPAGAGWHRRYHLAGEGSVGPGLPAASLAVYGNAAERIGLNGHADIARQLGVQNIQLSYPLFQQERDHLTGFDCVLVSVHSVEEAIQAARWGADGLLAGHIFATDCKKGVAPRGVAFLQQVCAAVSIPVYAIGGICAETWPLLQDTGAAGACVMSQAMTEGKFFWEKY